MVLQVAKTLKTLKWTIKVAKRFHQLENVLSDRCNGGLWVLVKIYYFNLHAVVGDLKLQEKTF